MRKLIIPALAIAIAFSVSAFTSKKSTSSFYVYTSSSHLKGDIQNINNYEADPNGCAGGSNVCGVQLTTAKTDGQHPVASEFSAEETNLWTSQQQGSPADGNIDMQN